MFFESIAHAMGAPGGGGQGGGAAGGLGAFLPLILMVVIFYFLLIRPQQKKAKQHKEFLGGLQKGDYVLTGGGIYGRIIEVEGDVLTVELGQGLTIRVNRNYISGPASPGDVKNADRKEKKDKE